MTNLALGPIGIATGLDSSPASLAAAATAEELGYPSLWLAGGPLPGLQTVVDVIEATNTLGRIPSWSRRSTRPRRGSSSARIGCWLFSNSSCWKRMRSALGAIAREPLGFLSKAPGYAANLARMGLSADEIGNLDARLVDAVTAWGTPSKIAERIDEQRDAGADHVAINVLTGVTGPQPIEQWRALAEVLLP